MPEAQGQGLSGIRHQEKAGENIKGEIKLQGYGAASKASPNLRSFPDQFPLHHVPPPESTMWRSIGMKQELPDALRVTEKSHGAQTDGQTQERKRRDFNS